MVDLSTLSLFLLAALMLFLSPGPNMAFVLSHGVAHGPRGGVAAALGIAAADLVRAPGRAVLTRGSQRTMMTVFRMAMFNCLLNPKALLFFLVFLPQFVDAARGQMALQLTVLGLTLTAASLVFHCGLGFFSGRVGAFLSRSPRAVRYQSWLLAAILASLAARLILLERPAR